MLNLRKAGDNSHVPAVWFAAEPEDKRSNIRFVFYQEGIDMAERENKEIKKAMNTLDFISADPKERERHNSIIMAEYNRLTSEHNFFEAGKKERKRRTEKKMGLERQQENY